MMVEVNGLSRNLACEFAKLLFLNERIGWAISNAGAPAPALLLQERKGIPDGSSPSSGKHGSTGSGRNTGRFKAVLTLWKLRTVTGFEVARLSADFGLGAR
jgi:hypothetical protein